MIYLVPKWNEWLVEAVVLLISKQQKKEFEEQEHDENRFATSGTKQL